MRRQISPSRIEAVHFDPRSQSTSPGGDQSAPKRPPSLSPGVSATVTINIAALTVRITTAADGAPGTSNESARPRPPPATPRIDPPHEGQVPTLRSTSVRQDGHIRSGALTARPTFSQCARRASSACSQERFFHSQRGPFAPKVSRIPIAARRPPVRTVRRSGMGTGGAAPRQGRGRGSETPVDAGLEVGVVVAEADLPLDAEGVARPQLGLDAAHRGEGDLGVGLAVVAI